MKKLFYTFLIVGLFAASGASAQMGMMGHSGGDTSMAALPQSPSITSALEGIYKSQNIADRNDVACDKVTDEEFIQLGDAVMDYGITEEQHSAMENMMGGEDAPATKQAHANMGRSYLGCPVSSVGTMGMPMVGYGKNDAQTKTGYAHWGMMGMGGHYGGDSLFGSVTMVLVWILLVLAIIALLKWLKKN